MKFKKVLAGFTAAALAVGSLSLVSFAADEEYIDVTVNTGYDFLSCILFTDGDNTYVVNGETVESAYWTQIDRQDNDGENTVYAGAFGGSEEEGFTQSVKFKALATNTNPVFTVMMWSNDLGKTIGHSVTLDLTKAENNVLNVGLTGTGDVADEQTYSWYYLQDADISYIAVEQGDEPEEPGEVTAPDDFIDSTGKAEILAQEDGVTFSHYNWDLGGCLDEGKTIADIKKVKVIFSDESVDQMTTSGAGGALVFMTEGSDWATNARMWCNGCAEDEEHDCQLDAETKSVTYIVADDVVADYANINMQKWWGTALVEIVKLEILDSTDAVIGTIEKEGDEPDDPVVPDSIPATVKFFTQGNENGDWAWVDNGDTEYTITSDSEAVDVKWEPITLSSKVTDADGFGRGGLQISCTDLALAGTKLNVEITDIMLDGNAIDDVVGEYALEENWDLTAIEIMILLDFINYETVGKDVSAKVKITTVSEENPGDTSSSDNTSEPEENTPVIVDNGNGNFVVPGGSSNQPSDTTADESKPAETAGDTSAENKPADATKPADDTTANGDDSSSAPSQQATEVTMDVQATDANNNVNGDSNANNADKNQNTGIVLAFIPAVAAAAGVVISKKRK